MESKIYPDQSSYHGKQHRSRKRERRKCPLKTIALVLVAQMLGLSLAQAPTNHLSGAIFTPSGSGIITSGSAAHDGVIQGSMLSWTGALIGDILTIQLASSVVIGSVIMVSPSAGQRFELNLYAGSDPLTLVNNKLCNPYLGGQATNDGVINCSKSVATVIQIEIVGPALPSYDFNEIYAFSQVDVATTNILITPYNSVLAGTLHGITPLSFAQDQAQLDASAGVSAGLTGVLEYQLPSSVSSATVMLVTTYASAGESVRISTSPTSVCSDVVMTAGAAQFSSCGTSSDTFILELYLSDSYLYLDTLAILIDPCQKTFGSKFDLTGVSLTDYVALYDVRTGPTLAFPAIPTTYIVQMSSCGWVVGPVEIFQDAGRDFPYTAGELTFDHDTAVPTFQSLDMTHSGSLSIYLSAPIIGDPWGNTLAPIEVRIDFFDSCSTTLLYPLSLIDMSVKYNSLTSLIQPLAIPSDSTSTTEASPGLCGLRSLEIIDLNEPAIPPSFVESYAATGHADGDVVSLGIYPNSDISLLGSYSLQVTVKLEEFPSIETVTTIIVDITCDPFEAMTLNQDTVASSLAFTHDVALTDQVVQLSAWSTVPASPCSTITGLVIIDETTGADATSLFTIESVSWQLVIIGDMSVTDTQATYRVDVQLQNEDDSMTSVAVADTFTVDWGSPCASATFNPYTVPIVQSLVYDGVAQHTWQHCEPADSAGSTLDSFYHCGDRVYSSLTLTQTGLAPAGITLTRDVANENWQLDLDFSLYDDTLLGLQEVTFTVSLASNPSESLLIRQQIQIQCPPAPLSVFVTGGAPQDPALGIPFFDTSLGPTEVHSVTLESYEIQPAFCVASGDFKLLDIMQDVTDPAAPIDMALTMSGDLATGVVTIVHDGTSIGIFGLSWSSQLPDGTVVYEQLFQIEFVSLNCIDAIFEPTITDLGTIHEQFQAGSIKDIPLASEVPVNIERLLGIPNYCGDRAWGTAKFLTLINGDTQWQTVYNDENLLGQGNDESVSVTLVDFPGPIHEFTITLKLSCPDFHTAISKRFDTAVVTVPQFFYDVTSEQVQYFAMNNWLIHPRDEQEKVQCFNAIGHKLREVETDQIISFIWEDNFNLGSLAIQQTDMAYQGLTRNYEWFVQVDDGTETKIITFTVVYRVVSSCLETELQQGWPKLTSSDRFFEIEPTRHPLIQPTNSYAELIGDPDACGGLSYRVVRADSKENYPYFYTDLPSAQTFYMYFDNEWAEVPDGLQYFVEVTLTNYPSVIPVYQYMMTYWYCPEFHQGVKNIEIPSTEITYDITEATAQVYPLKKLSFLNPNCFKGTDSYILDANGVRSTFATASDFVLGDVTISLIYLLLGGSSTPPPFNAMTIDMAGERKWEWLTTPITLHWAIDLDDGLTRFDELVFTVQGVSTCSSAIFGSRAPVQLSTLPEGPPVTFHETNYIDSVSQAKGNVDYCGPHVYNLVQTDPNGLTRTINKGVFSTPAQGELRIDFEEATHQDTGLYTFEMTITLLYFPEVATFSQVVTMEYLCPTESLIEVIVPMTEFSYTYYIYMGETLQSQLTLLRLSKCHSITWSRVIRTDTGDVVDFFSVDLFTAQFNMFTADVDKSLGGQTLEFSWLVDLSDGRTAYEVNTWTVTFIGQNYVPYFDPPLTSYLQIFKQDEPIFWSFKLPPYFDEDAFDEPSISVDFSAVANFMTYEEEEFWISDLSDPSLPTGSFKVFVTLSDGKDDLVTDVTVIMHESSFQPLDEGQAAYDQTTTQPWFDEMVASGDIGGNGLADLSQETADQASATSIGSQGTSEASSTSSSTVTVSGQTASSSSGQSGSQETVSGSTSEQNQESGGSQALTDSSLQDGASGDPSSPDALNQDGTSSLTGQSDSNSDGQSGQGSSSTQDSTNTSGSSSSSDSVTDQTEIGGSPQASSSGSQSSSQTGSLASDVLNGQLTEEGPKEISGSNAAEFYAKYFSSQMDGQSQNSSQDSSQGTESSEEKLNKLLEFAANQQRVEDWRSVMKLREKALRDSGAWYDFDRPSARISTVQQTGQVLITFDQPMQVLPDLAMLTQGLVEVSGVYLPVFEVALEPAETQDLNQIEFTWEVQSMTPRELTIQMKFEKAVYISAEIDPDVIKITFRDPYLFVSIHDQTLSFEKDQSRSELRALQIQGQVWIAVDPDKDGWAQSDESFVVLERDLPSQLQLDGSEEQIQKLVDAATDGVMAYMVSNFILNILISASLNQLWSMINTQQLIVMMPLFEVSMPANAGIFFRNVMEIAAFDFYDFTELIHGWFGLPPTEPVDQNFEAVGFESLYFLVNMGTLIVFYALYIVQVCFSIVASCARYQVTTCCSKGRCKCRCLRKCTKNVKERTFWGDLITLLNESYQIVVVCTLINLDIFSMETRGQAVMSVACATFIALSIYIPAFMLGRLSCAFDKLKSQSWKDHYGALYEDLRLKAGRKVLLVPAFFLVRRYMIAVGVTYAGRFLIAQVFIMAAQIIIQVIIVGEGVFESRSQSYMEYFNELILMLVMYTIVCFSPMVDHPPAKFQIGYVTIVIVMLHFLVSLLLICRSTIKSSCQKCRKRRQKNLLKKQRKANQAKLDQNHEKRRARILKSRNEILLAELALQEKAEQEMYSLYGSEVEDNSTQLDEKARLEAVAAQRNANYLNDVEYALNKQDLNEGIGQERELLADGKMAGRIQSRSGVGKVDQLESVSEQESDSCIEEDQSHSKLSISKSVDLDEFEAELDAVSAHQSSILRSQALIGHGLSRFEGQRQSVQSEATQGGDERTGKFLTQHGQTSWQPHIKLHETNEHRIVPLEEVVLLKLTDVKNGPQGGNQGLERRNHRPAFTLQSVSEAKLKEQELKRKLMPAHQRKKSLQSSLGAKASDTSNQKLKIRPNLSIASLNMPPLQLIPLSGVKRRSRANSVETVNWAKSSEMHAQDVIDEEHFLEDEPDSAQGDRHRKQRLE